MAKGDYNPPQGLLLEASRMFRTSQTGTAADWAHSREIFREHSRLALWSAPPGNKTSVGTAHQADPSGSGVAIGRPLQATAIQPVLTSPYTVTFGYTDYGGYTASAYTSATQSYGPAGANNSRPANQCNNNRMYCQTSGYIIEALTRAYRVTRRVARPRSGGLSPNKNLVPALLDELCKGYRRLDQLQQIEREGVQVRLKKSPPRQLQCLPNHGSARDCINVLRKSIRKEQDAWRCLVLDMDIQELWPEITIAPFGVVDKGGEDSSVSGRTIHDLSYPEGTSINDCTDQESITRPDYVHCDAIATEIICAKQPTPVLQLTSWPET
ncbi:hypothetical protein ON010_g17860 [Phytophthora cinnamomi]|nr:hypothetical protein ON010_g17860 [Phytophthora cinnamomi]